MEILGYDARGLIDSQVKVDKVIAIRVFYIFIVFTL